MTCLLKGHRWLTIGHSRDCLRCRKVQHLYIGGWFDPPHPDEGRKLPDRIGRALTRWL
jgi:hypothetical protein